MALADVLRTAGVKASAVYTANHGADAHISGDPATAAVARRAAAQGDGPVQPAGLGHERQAVGERARRAAAPSRSGVAGSVSHKWLTRITLRDKVHDGPGMTGTRDRVAIKPMLPGGKVDEANLKILESMPVRSIVTSPANGTRPAPAPRRSG